MQKKGFSRVLFDFIFEKGATYRSSNTPVYKYYIKNRLRGKNLHIKCKNMRWEKIPSDFTSKKSITVHAYVLGIITS